MTEGDAITVASGSEGSGVAVVDAQPVNSSARSQEKMDMGILQGTWGKPDQFSMLSGLT